VPPSIRGRGGPSGERAGPAVSGGPYDENVLGYLPASVKTTQLLGTAVGVTALAGRIYAESDMNTVYALNAMTGARIWQSPTINAAMGNPVIGDGLVFVGAGDTGFSFQSVLRYASGAPGVTRGMGFAAVYAFDENTGRQVWKFDTKGEDMPSLSYLGGKVYIGNGDGHMYALDAKTARPAWITSVGGFDSMSSTNYWHDPATGQDLVFAGFSDPNYLYAFDAQTGKVVWHILARYNAGGRYGIVNPVIVGGTMYLGNSCNWVQAIPLSRIYPAWLPGRRPDQAAHRDSCAFTRRDTGAERPQAQCPAAPAWPGRDPRRRGRWCYARRPIGL
jgi:outer membrane protein assembly factor BamB